MTPKYNRCNSRERLLIADAGATKTDWLFFEGDPDAVLMWTTEGIHALTTPADRIQAILNDTRARFTPETRFTRVALYGAGCGLPEVCSRLAQILAETFNCDEAEAASDMLGMARALFGYKEGVACILGTGSNSCYYDGENIVRSVPALGYVLGDEGGGVGIGKRFLKLLLKGKLPQECVEAAENAGITKDEVIRRVYKGERPNAYIASVVPLVKSMLHIEEVRTLVEAEFDEFIQLNLTNYPAELLQNTGFGGSIAEEFKNELRASALKNRICIGKIMRHPLKGLLDYYLI